MDKFKVGDRVVAVSGCFPYFMEGNTGGVVSVDSSGYWVQWDAPVHGDGRWYVSDCNTLPAPRARYVGPSATTEELYEDNWRAARDEHLQEFVDDMESGR